MKGDDSFLHKFSGIGGIISPFDLTHIRGLNKQHIELPDLLSLPFLASSQHKIVLVVGEDAISKADYVAGLEIMALVTPKLEVERSGLVGGESQACGLLPVLTDASLLQKYELCVYCVGGSRDNVFEGNH